MSAETRYLGELPCEVILPKHDERVRAHLSGGLVRDAQKFAIHDLELLKDVICGGTPLVGLELPVILGAPGPSYRHQNKEASGHIAPATVFT